MIVDNVYLQFVDQFAFIGWEKRDTVSLVASKTHRTEILHPWFPVLIFLGGGGKNEDLVP
jgi:hypothetical protein